MNGWSAILLGAAALVLCVTTWLGWRAGAVRQLVSLAALVLASVIAFFGGRLAAPLLRAVGITERWTFVGAVVLALGVYGLVTLLSWLLLKKTRHQEVGPVRLIYGVIGAVIGLLKGLLVVWAAAVGIRFAGEITALQSELAQRAVPAPSKDRRSSPPSASGEALAEMSRALDHGVVGDALDYLDPVPAPIRQNAPRLMRVLSDDSAMSRFRAYPGVRDLVNNPKIIDLGTDRQFQKAAAAGDLIALARHPGVQAILADEQILGTLQKVELAKALDYALAAKSRAAPLPNVPTSRPKPSPP